ncbi:Multidrug resistance protein MexB [Usitatibacter rugosus]|uniref:Multidrug resistance protein MexB n=1 Tax=Usitatibacter rugosus TaxID=2732067 RepID=A0A6M4GTH3_9PROT|nr:efflux RND transporter permease subunit [Usitatibacter rugosus]QJR10639.1 Multidrug resistance protein MexB [Usitatibacter rugosus]
MTLPEICIKRPVFATVLSIVVLLIGFISYSRLSVREYPRIDEPVVTVETRYLGASAEVVESQITKVLEDSLAGIEGVDVMTSVSRSETSQITARFKLSRDPDSAAADVRDKVARVRARLPEAIDEPVIAKVEADSFPIMWLAISTPSKSAIEVSDYANRYIKPRLSTLPGAADVRIFGERKVSMRIWLDPAKLAAYRLTPADVEDALRRQNVEIPAGRIESDKREFSVLSQTDLQTPDQFDAIVIRDVAGYPVRIRDIGRAQIAPVDERVVARFMGNSAVTMGVIKQAVANPLDLSKAVRKEIDEINKSLVDMKIEVVYDSSLFIEQSIRAVFQTIVEAVVLVAIVIFLFLRNFRATLIPLVTIPVSLVGAFTFMYLFGFSVNTLTLLAMVLAIGLVVDDAIVVLENIYRHLEEGMSRLDAALLGAREIAFAVIAMTITLAAVFAPLAFQTGRTGRLFIEFALALAGAVLVSGFVALTLSPMMCSKLLKHETKHGRFYNMTERWFRNLIEGYKRLLDRALHHRAYVLGAALFVGCLSVVLALTLRSELSPIEDRGAVFGFVSAPEGATVRFTAENLKKVEDIYRTVPETIKFNALAGFPTVADGIAIARLAPWNERKRSQQDITTALMPEFQKIPGVRAFPTNTPSLGQSPRSRPVEFVVMSQAPFEVLQKYVDAIILEASKTPGLQNLDSDLRLDKPELKVSVNREKISDVGASVDAVGRTLETMLGGRQVTRFKKDGEQYDVIVQVADADRRSPTGISDIYVRGKNNEMIQLSNLVIVREGVAPKNLNHFNRIRSATITATLAPGYPLGDALNAMQEAAKKSMPVTVNTDLNGVSREFRDSSTEIYFVFLLALAFIFLVLAAQFESFIDPFIIMLTVPLAMTGALLALWLAGGTLNIYSKIGLVTLVGLITKHGILIVEFANQIQSQGKSVIEAVEEAAVLRLRPILMTTGAMVLGAVPLAFATGAGAESRQQIGWVIVGGMLLGTLLTLFVVPTAYTLLARKHKTFDERLAEDRAGNTSAHAPAD